MRDFIKKKKKTPNCTQLPLPHPSKVALKQVLFSHCVCISHRWERTQALITDCFRGKEQSDGEKGQNTGFISHSRVFNSMVASSENRNLRVIRSQCWEEAQSTPWTGLAIRAGFLGTKPLGP